MAKLKRLGALLGAAVLVSGLAVVAPTATGPAFAVEVVQDGSLEAATGNPLDSPAWAEADSQFDSPICQQSVSPCGDTSLAPHSGTKWAWFGGSLISGHTASLSQELTIPEGGATLTFWLANEHVSAPFVARLQVKIDGVVVREHVEQSVPDTAYAQQMIDVSPWADGGQHTLSFEYGDGGSGFQSMFVDDISIDAAPGGFTAVPGSLGPIPDSDPTGCPAPGPPRDVTFDVRGLLGPPTDVSVRMSVSHQFGGDVTATLIAPDGTTTPLFGITGATVGGDPGDSSSLSGPYTFSDRAPASPRWWDAAASAAFGEEIAAGVYRAAQLGGPGSTGANTSITPAFAGLATVKGTWKLRLFDTCPGALGEVTAARLLLTTAQGPDTDEDGIPDAADHCPAVAGLPGTGCPDTSAPDTSFTASPPGGIAKALTVPFGFASTEAGSFVCSLDGTPYAACTTPTSVTVTSGAHTFRVAARDAAGNTDATPAASSFQAYDCATLTAKVTTLKKKVNALRKAVKATKAKLERAKTAGDEAKVSELKVKLKKLLRKLKRAKVRLAKARAAAEPCRV